MLDASLELTGPEVRRPEESVVPLISLVIPAKDEAARLPATLDGIARWTTARRFPIEVVVVDDGSQDGTSTVAEAFRRRLRRLTVVRHKTQTGKGAALRSGFSAATSPVIAFSDADMSAPIDDLPRLLAALVDGADVAVGSRRRAEPRGFVRGAASRCFSWIARTLVPVGVADTQCGFKAFRAEAARRIVAMAEVDGFAFDVEWLALARRLGLRIAESPVRWRDDRRSTVRVAVAGREMLRDLLSLRRRLRAWKSSPSFETGESPAS